MYVIIINLINVAQEGGTEDLKKLSQDVLVKLV